MFLRHARTTRLAAAYLLFAFAQVMVPRADIQETLFDEANTPTNEMEVGKDASSGEHQQSDPLLLSGIFTQPRRISIHRIWLVYSGQLTDSLRFPKLSCLLC